MSNGEDDIAPKRYRRPYSTALGPRVRYYAVFTDYESKRRKFAVGRNLKAAIKKLYEFDKKNDNAVDFDEQKQKRAAKGMTFGKFVAQCSESMRSKSKWHLKHLEKFFGPKAIAQVCDDDVTVYREKRSKEKIIRHGEESAKLVSQTTLNK